MNQNTKMDKIRIRKGEKRDADVIADGIMMAVGDELVAEIANGRPREAVHAIFRDLALMEDSQYSFRNALIAEDEKGSPMGMVVAYDGKILMEARKLFFSLTKEYLGWDIYELTEGLEPEPETDGDEYYLDSLAVWPEYRGRGVASRLIGEVKKLAIKAGKPVGLLCAEGNSRAEKLYRSLGFEAVGVRPFAGEAMTHFLSFDEK